MFVSVSPKSAGMMSLRGLAIPFMLSLGGQSQFSYNPVGLGFAPHPLPGTCGSGLKHWTLLGHTRVSYSMGNEHQIVCEWFWIYAEDSWAVTHTAEGTLSQTCFVPSTPVWLFAEALNSSVTQHVVCACLAVHKTSKDIVRGLHISKPETVQSMLMFPYLQVNKKKKKKWRNKSGNWLFDF